MRIHLFVAPNGIIVCFPASLLDKTSNPTWNCKCAVFGTCYIKYTSLCSLLPLSEIAIFGQLFYLWWSQTYILTYTHSGGICISAALSWNLSSSSLLVCNPLIITALLEHVNTFLISVSYLSFLSLFLDVMASSRSEFALAFGSVRRGINSAGQFRACCCCCNVPCALQHYRSVSVKVNTIILRGDPCQLLNCRLPKLKYTTKKLFHFY